MRLTVTVDQQWYPLHGGIRLPRYWGNNCDIIIPKFRVLVVILRVIRNSSLNLRERECLFVGGTDVKTDSKWRTKKQGDRILR